MDGVVTMSRGYSYSIFINIKRYKYIDMQKQQRPTLYIDTNWDKNIWHMYMMEILEIGRLMSKNKTVDHLLLTNYNESSSVDVWRTHVLQYLVNNIYVSQRLTTGKKNSIVKELPREMIFFQPEMLKIHFQWYDCWTPTNYTINEDVVQFLDTLKARMNIQCELKHIKFINRKSSRQVFDSVTYEPIETELIKYGVQCAYFEDLHPRDQIEFVKDARILIAPHGAGLTNLIFTHNDCIVCELNLRKHWFCNPICEKHKTGQLKIEEDCGKGPKFSKYDFNNMCKLLGRQYYELMPDKYTDHSCESTMTRNFMVDSKQLVSYLHTVPKKLCKTN